jgi:hypothetical protein
MMVVPPASDPRWRAFVTQAAPTFANLATRMMFTRVQMLVRKGDARSIDEAIDVAHGYFQHNAAMATQDLKF